MAEVSHNSFLSKFKDKSLIVLLIANLYLMFGVLYLGWDLIHVLLLYWVDSILVGIIHVVKYLNSYLKTKSSPTLFKMVLFIIYYSIYSAFILFAINVIANNVIGIKDITLEERLKEILFPIINTFLSYVFVLLNVLKQKETENKDFTSSDPFTRVFIMHASIISGAYFWEFLDLDIDLQVVIIALLVAFKTAIDLYKPVSRNVKFKDA